MPEENISDILLIFLSIFYGSSEKQVQPIKIPEATGAVSFTCTSSVKLISFPGVPGAPGLDRPEEKLHYLEEKNNRKHTSQ